MIEITPGARARIQEFVAAEVVRDPALRITLDTSNPSPLVREYTISLVDKEDRERTEIAVNVDGIRVFLNLDTVERSEDRLGGGGRSVGVPRT
jgi:Fe/S biogenesis protein NfuA